MIRESCYDSTVTAEFGTHSPQGFFIGKEIIQCCHSKRGIRLLRTVVDKVAMHLHDGAAKCRNKVLYPVAESLQ